MGAFTLYKLRIVIILKRCARQLKFLGKGERPIFCNFAANLVLIIGQISHFYAEGKIGDGGIPPCLKSPGRKLHYEPGSLTVRNVFSRNILAQGVCNPVH